MLHNRASIRTVAPAETPVSLAEIKAHVGAADFEDDDELLQSLLDAVVAYLDGPDGYLKCALVTQTWQHKFAGWSAYEMRLPLQNGSSISVSYTDPDEVTQTLSASLYQVVEDDLSTVLIPMPQALWPATAVTASPVTITATHGYGSASAVPAPIKHAIKLMVGDFYAHRETVAAAQMSEIPLSVTVSALLSPYRRKFFAA